MKMNWWWPMFETGTTRLWLWKWHPEKTQFNFVWLGDCLAKASHLSGQKSQTKEPTTHKDLFQNWAPFLVLRFSQFSFGDYCRFRTKSFLVSLVGEGGCQRCSFTVLRIFHSFWDGLYIYSQTNKGVTKTPEFTGNPRIPHGLYEIVHWSYETGKHFECF